VNLQAQQGHQQILSKKRLRFGEADNDTREGSIECVCEGDCSRLNDGTITRRHDGTKARKHDYTTAR